MTQPGNSLEPRLSEVARAAGYWDDRVRVSMEERALTGWLDCPLVKTIHINPRFGVADSEGWLGYFARKYQKAPALRALTLGCGDGGLERHGCHLKMALSFDAVDISRASLAIAREKASALGLDNITYWEADLNRDALPKERYDLVCASMAIHHVENLEHLFAEVRESLRPGGLLVLNEYVGPNRFQWTPLQMAVVNSLLSTIPTRLKRDIRSGGLKRRIKRPTVESMVALDPSESVRSSEILGIVDRFFVPVERIDYGGMFLHLLLSDIAGNFRPDSALDAAVLTAASLLERGALAIGVPTDFSFVVARRE